MPITILCPTCGKRLKAPDDAAGRTVKCPGCGESMALPDAAARGPAPVVAARPWPTSEPDEYEDDEPPRPNRRRSSRRRVYDEGDDRWARRDDGRYGRRVSPTSRTVYIVLGLFLGGLGIHNFVAGRTGVAIAQLGIWLVSIPLMCIGVGLVTILIPSIWALVDIIAVQHDGEGRRMI